MSETAYASVHGARLHYELAGQGAPFVMLHAGIADSRMWAGEFSAFAPHFRVLRYDMRGYGRSLPVPGAFNLQDDLRSLLDALELTAPAILMGCSMGGGLAIDYALAHPESVSALILVGSGPAGLELDVEGPEALFAESEAAFKASDIERVAELDMRIWFDGWGRATSEVDPVARERAKAMARLVTRHELQNIGEHVRKPVDMPAARRLDELTMPALIVIGEHDLPFLQAASRFLLDGMPGASELRLSKAGHLPNLEQPARFQEGVLRFLGVG